MASDERKNNDRVSGLVPYEELCRDLGLSIDRTSLAERKVDRALVNGWLRAVHECRVDPLFEPIIAAFFGDSSGANK